MFITRAFIWAVIFILGVALVQEGSMFGALLAGAAGMRLAIFILKDARKWRPY